MKVYMGILNSESFELMAIGRYREMIDISEVSDLSMTYEPFPHYHRIADRNFLFVVVENSDVAKLFFEKISEYRKKESF